MNLVQIQNRLKEMPTQVVMGYANGSNPQVPPYLALGELNRRKQMEQESKTQEAPQQSVKDQIEQQVKLMQTMAGRQQEAMQQQNQMLGQQSMIAPKSTPVTDAEAFAAGGVARLPTELRFNRGGGIVAFASPNEENNYGQVTDEEEKKKRSKEEGSALAIGTGVLAGGSVPPAQLLNEMLTQAVFNPNTTPKQALGRAAMGAGTLTAVPLTGTILSAKALQQVQNMTPEERRAFYSNPMIGGMSPDSALASAIMNAGEGEIAPPKESSYGSQIMNVIKAVLGHPDVSAPPPKKPSSTTPVDKESADKKTTSSEAEEKAAPKEMSTAEKVALLMGNRGGGGGGGGARPAASGDIYSMMSKALGASKFEEGPDYEKFMEQQKAKNKYLQGLPGEKYESLLEEIRRQDLADRERFKQQEQDRQGRRLMDVLMGAGAGMGKFAPKAQTGGAGILNLLGGIGQQAGAMREADIQRTKEQSALERQQNLAYAEMLSKIEDVRRAEARGDAKAIFDAKQDAAKAKREFEKSQLDALYKGSTVEEQRRHGMAVEGIQRLQASQAGRDLIRERAALLASLPENKNKSMTELLQMAAGLPQGAQFESAEVRRLREAEAAWEKGKMERMQQGIKPGSPEEAAKRKEHDKKWGIAPGSASSGSDGKWGPVTVESPR